MPNVAKELGEEHAKDKFMEACDASRKEKFGELSVLNVIYVDTIMPGTAPTEWEAIIMNSVFLLFCTLSVCLN